VLANSWTFDESDLDTLVDDPAYFFDLNGYFFVIGYSTGASFEGNLIYKSKD